METRRILFINHSKYGTENLGIGARSVGLASNLKDFSADFVYSSDSGKFLINCLNAIKKRPDFVYVIEVGGTGLLVGLIGRFFYRAKYIQDLGDENFALAKINGRGGAVHLVKMWIFEKLILYFSNGIATRGTYHKELFERRDKKNIITLQDGYFVHEIKNVDEAEVLALREELDIKNKFTFGLVGSLNISPNIGICYGWDVVRALSFIKDPNVVGVIMGGGDGENFLKTLARELGVQDRIIFTGFIPYLELSKYLGVLDMCVSTQTNNIVGWVRTTSKLVNYIINDKVIAASDVGEAHYILPSEFLLEYNGTVDEDYPERLAKKVLEFKNKFGVFGKYEHSRGVKEMFLYDNLSERLNTFLLKFSGK